MNHVELVIQDLESRAQQCQQLIEMLRSYLLTAPAPAAVAPGVTKEHQVAPGRRTGRPRKVKAEASATPKRSSSSKRPATLSDRIRDAIRALPAGVEFSAGAIQDKFDGKERSDVCARLLGFLSRGELNSTGTGRQRRYRVHKLHDGTEGLPPASAKEESYRSFRETIKTHQLPEEA